MTTGKRFRMSPPRRLRARASRWAALALLASLIPAGGAAAAVDATAPVPNDPVAASRGQTQIKTVITGRLEPGLCFTLSMPAEWQVTIRDGATTRLRERASGIELEIALRAAADLREGGQPDLVRRDAAILQASYEALIGRPAQAVSLDPLPVLGALRWRATWADGNMPGGGSFTAETFIVPLSSRWLAEVTLDNVDARPLYEAVLEEALSGLEIRQGGDCGRQAGPAAR